MSAEQPLSATSAAPAVPEDTVTYHFSRKEILELQIRAFLDASDDVDLTQDVAEELLSCLSISAVDNDDEDESPKLPGTESDRPADENMDDDDAVVEITTRNGELDIWSIFDPLDKAEDSWTKQEIRSILHHLKERGSSSFINEFVIKRAIPIPKLLNAFGIDLCPEILEKSVQTLMYILHVGMSFQLRKREKLIQYNSIADAVQLIRNSQRILILTGAGISVSCGIPDFRSRDGLYAMLKERGEYDLDDPQQMFDIEYFRENPSVFYSFASQIYPSNFVPSPCHRFIKAVEEHGKLLRNYTQNIDTLETLVGVERILQCHGSFATASCLVCRRQVPGLEIESEILTQKVPLCKVCAEKDEKEKAEREPTPPPPPVKKKKPKKGKKEWEHSDSDDDRLPPVPKYPPYLMKPDITFFGEKLNDVFDRSLAEDREKLDLLLVIGTSLKVSPVADILSHLPHSIPQILINKTPIKHINPDIVLLGNADDIVLHLADELGWELPSAVPTEGNSTLRPPRKRARNSRLPSDSRPIRTPTRVGNSHVWLFEGAEGGKWIDEVQEAYAGAEWTPSKSQSASRRQSPSGSQTSEKSAKKVGSKSQSASASRRQSPSDSQASDERSGKRTRVS